MGTLQGRHCARASSPRPGTRRCPRGSLGLPTFCSSTQRQQCAQGPVQPEDAPGSARPAQRGPCALAPSLPHRGALACGQGCCPRPGGRGCAALSGTAAGNLSSSSPWQRQRAPSAEAGPACPHRPQGTSCLPPAGCRGLGPRAWCGPWRHLMDVCEQPPLGPECSHGRQNLVTLGSAFLYLLKFYLKLFYVLGHFPAPSLQAAWFL